MKTLVVHGVKPVDSFIDPERRKKWSLMEKLFLGLTPVITSYSIHYTKLYDYQPTSFQTS